MPNEEELEKRIDEEIDKINSDIELKTETPAEVKIKATAAPKTKLKNTGGASDIFEIAETGKTKSKKVHQIYKKSDSVEDMAKATVDLISESSRSLLKNLENQENEQLNVMLRRTYVPRQAKIDDGSDLDKVMESLHLF